MLTYIVQFEGYEYDWLCVDRSGHLAIVSTQGCGLLPPGYDEEAQAAVMCSVLGDAFLATYRGDRTTWRLGDQLQQHGLWSVDVPGFGAYVCTRRPGSPLLASADVVARLTAMHCLVPCDVARWREGDVLVTWTHSHGPPTDVRCRIETVAS